MRVRVVCGILLSLVATSSNAALIRYEAAGTISEIVNIYGGDHELPSITEGAPWAATLFVELPGTDINASPNVAWYTNGIYGSMTIGALSLGFQDGEVTIFDEYPSSSGPLDGVTLYWQPPIPLEERPVVDGWSFHDAGVSLGGGLAGRGIDQSLLSTIGINGVDLMYALLDIHFVRTAPGFTFTEHTNVYGSVTSISATVVPLPATAWLLGTAIASLHRRRLLRSTGP